MVSRVRASQATVCGLCRIAAPHGSVSKESRAAAVGREDRRRCVVRVQAVQSCAMGQLVDASERARKA